MKATFPPSKLTSFQKLFLASLSTILAVFLSVSSSATNITNISRDSELKHEELLKSGINNSDLSKLQSNSQNDSIQIAQLTDPVPLGVPQIRYQSDKDALLQYIAIQLATAGEYEQALQLVQTLAPEWQDRTLIEIAIKLAETGHIQQTQQLIQNIKSPTIGEYRDDIFKVITQLIATGKFEEATKIAEIFRYSSIGGLNLEDFNSFQAYILPALIELEQYDRALELTRNINDETEKNSAIKEIAVGLAKSGRFEEALALIEPLPETDWERSKISIELAKSGQFEQALALVQESEISHKDSTLSEIAVELAKKGQANRAIELAQTFYNPESTISKIALAIAETGQTEQALKIAELIEDNREENLNFLPTSEDVIQSLLPPNSSSRLSGLFGLRDSLKSLTLRKIVFVTAKIGQVEKALEISQSFEDQFLKASALSSVASVLIEAGNYDQAKQVFSQSLTVSRSVDNLPEKLSIYSEIYQSLIPGSFHFFENELSDSDLVLSTFTKISNLNWTLNYPENEENLEAILLYRTSLHLAKNQKYNEALQVAKTIKPDDIKNLTFSEISFQLTQARKLDQALQVGRTIKDSYWKSKVLANLAANLEKADQKSQSQLIFSEALQLVNVAEEESNKPAILAAVAVTFAEAGNLERAFQITEMLETNRTKALTLIGIGSQLIVSKQYDQALELSERVKDYPEFYESLLAAIAVELIKTGQDQKGLEITKSLNFLSTAINPSVAIALAEIGKYEQAIATAQTLDNQTLKAGTLQEIAQKLIDAKQFDWAEKILLETLTLLQKNPKPQGTFLNENRINSQDLSLLFDIPAKLIQAGKAEKAFQVVQTLTQIVQDEIDKDIGTNSLLDSLVKLGEYDQAFKLAQILLVNDYSCWYCFAVKLADADQFELALEAAKNAKDNTCNLNIQSRMAIHLAETQQLEQALEIVKTIQIGKDKALALSKVAVSLVHNNQQEQANELLTEARKISETLNQTDKEFVWENLAESLAEAGQFDQAFEVAQQIKDVSFLLRYTNIAVSFSQAGKLNQIKQLLSKIKSQEDISHEDMEQVELSLVEKLIEGKQFQQGLEITQMLQSESQKVKALQYIATNLAKAGYDDQALEIAQGMPYNYQKAFVLTQIAQQYVEAKQMSQAFQYLDQALAFVQ